MTVNTIEHQIGETGFSLSKYAETAASLEASLRRADQEKWMMKVYFDEDAVLVNARHFFAEAFASLDPAGPHTARDSNALRVLEGLLEACLDRTNLNASEIEMHMICYSLILENCGRSHRLSAAEALVLPRLLKFLTALQIAAEREPVHADAQEALG